MLEKASITCQIGVYMSKKRVVFTFDERSLDSLEQLKEHARFDSLAEAVRNSLQVARALQQQKEQGYTEVVVRNPDSKEERVVVIPNL
jgi:hypothetical protein